MTPADLHKLWNEHASVSGATNLSKEKIQGNALKSSCAQEECKRWLSCAETMRVRTPRICVGLSLSGNKSLDSGLCSSLCSAHILVFVTLSCHRCSAQCAQRGHTSPLHTLPPRLSTRSSALLPHLNPAEFPQTRSSSDSPALCPTAAPSTPTWSPWPASSWSRAGRPKARGSWPRCSTRCARRWRPSPALCAKLGSPTCEWATLHTPLGLEVAVTALPALFRTWMQRCVKPSAARRAPGSLRQSESAYLEQTRPFYETCFGPQVVITAVLVFF